MFSYLVAIDFPEYPGTEYHIDAPDWLTALESALAGAVDEDKYDEPFTVLAVKNL